MTPVSSRRALAWLAAAYFAMGTSTLAMVGGLQAIADGLQAGGARSDWRADRAAEPVSDRNLSGSEVNQEGRHRERRELTRTALIDGVHRLLHRGEAADAGGDDSRGAVAFAFGRGSPGGLSDRFIGGRHRELDEAVHTHLILRIDGAIGIEPALGVFSHRRHDAGDLGRDIRDEIV